MATSLARQLLALAGPQTSRLTKEHAVSSLLFQPAQAAEIERDDIFLLALTGLEELEGLHPSFYKFRSTIFSEESKNMERSVLNREVNDKLNREIASFLRLLSPFFLIKPAHKALEWLIRRFQIHLYNVDLLMKCALPFHESKIFARVVQILDMNLVDGNKWRWLTPFQKNGIPITKSTLINHCQSDIGFLHFICQLTKEAVESAELSNGNLTRTTTSFYLSTVLGVLKASKEISENVFTLITPYVLFGLKSRNLDLVSTSYFILVYISQTVYLEQSWFEAVFVTILKNIPDNMEKEALRCFVVCFSAQQTNSISAPCCKLLLKAKMKASLEEIADNPFMKTVCRHLIVWAVKMAMKGFDRRAKDAKWLLNKVHMTDKDIKYIYGFAVKFYLKNSKKYENSAGKYLENLSGLLQRKYPNAFDCYLEEFNSSQSDENIKSLFSVIGQQQQANDLSGKGNADFYLYLNHPSSVRRKCAVEALGSTVVVEDLEDVLLTRLQDDDPTVVRAVLQSPKLSVVPNQILKKGLIDLICVKYTEEGWGEVTKITLILLKKMSLVEDDYAKLLCILPLLFPTSLRNLKHCKRSVSKVSDEETPGSLFWDIWQALGKRNLEMGDFEIANSLSLLMKQFAETVSKLSDKDKKTLLSELIQKNKFFAAGVIFRNAILPLLIAEVACNSVSTRDDMQLVLEYFSSFVAEIDLLKIKKSDFDFPLILEKSSILAYFDLIKNQLNEKRHSTSVFYASSFIYAVKLVVSKCGTSPDHVELIVTTLISWATETTLVMQNICKTILKFSFKQCLKKGADLLNILLKCLGRSDSSCPYIVHCLYLLKHIVPLMSCHPHHETVLATLLFYCAHSREVVRRAAVECVTIIGGPFHIWTHTILAYWQDVENDPCHLPKILKRISDYDGNRFILHILDWICDEHLPYFIRLGNLNCLQLISSPLILKRLLLVCKQLLQISSEPLTVYQHALVQNIFNHINLLSLNGLDDFTLLMEVLSIALRHLTKQLQGLPTVQEMILERIKNSIYDSFSRSEQKRQLIHMMMDIHAGGGKAAAGLQISKVLRSVLNDGTEIAYHLDLILHNKATSKSSLRCIDLKQRNDGQSESLLVLEAIEGKSEIRNRYVLIPVMFQFLKQTLDDNATTDYELELLLSCILDACSAIDVLENVDQSHFNIELLIRCIQRKSTPRFHGAALLTLSTVAQLFPEFVLRNAVIVFTLMSSGSLVYQEDSYSFGIILTTLEKVLPSIFKILQSSDDPEEELQSVSTWIRIFVDALPDILEHRRHPLLTTLLSSLGTDNEWLWLLLFSVLQLYVSWETNSSSRNNEEKKLTVAFAVEFCHQFLPSDQISAAIRLVNELVELLNGNEQCWLQSNLDKYKQQLCYVTVGFISALFASHAFLTQLVDTDESIVTLYKNITKAVLQLLSTVQHLLKRDANTWKRFIARCYHLLDRTVSVVPERMFIEIAGELLTKDDVRLQCKVVEMLTAKLKRGSGKIQFEQLKDIFNYMLDIVKRPVKEKRANTDGLVLRQLTLFCFKFLIRFHAANNEKPFQKLATLALDVLSKETNDHIISNAFLCLAELCSSLQAHFIVHLNQLMPVVIKFLENEKRFSKNDLLLMSLITLLSKLIECQQQFLSPFLASILHQVCRLRTFHSSALKTPISGRLTFICRNLSKKVEPRILLPAVTSSYETLIAGLPKDVIPLMEIVTQMLRISKDAIGVWYEYLANFFFRALDYRSSHNNETEETIASVERCLFQPVIVLVMKMSEVTFRPFFIKFFEWATKEEELTERLFTFYNLTDCIVDQLKSLFVLFAGHLVLHMVSLLEANNNSNESARPTFADETKNDQLLCFVFDILYKCFINDTQGFINKERFLTLMPPLVDQLENTTGNFGERMKHLIPCLANMSQAVKPDVGLQPFVYNILLKTRSSSTQVKCAALETLRQVAKKLNEDFLSLLPETIPFLAELMEDDVLEVEQLCQEVIVDMEEIVGEPLQKYFNT